MGRLLILLVGIAVMVAIDTAIVLIAVSTSKKH